jgi:hypothetical protein
VVKALTERLIIPAIISEYSIHEEIYMKSVMQMGSRPSIKVNIALQVLAIFDQLYKNMVTIGVVDKGAGKNIVYSSLLRNVLSPSKATIEHTCQHLFCIEHAIIIKDLPYLLVVEDDAIPVSSNIAVDVDRLMHYAKLSLKDDFFIDLGNGLGLTAKKANQYSDQKSKSLRPLEMVDSGRTRCSYAYILSISACKIITTIMRRNEYIPLMPSDWHLSLLLKESGIDCYWSSKPLFVQGSESGKYISNQSVRLGTNNIANN